MPPSPILPLILLTIATTASAQLPPGVWVGPKDPFVGELPKLTDDERSLATRLKTHVEMLATEIGQRNVAKPRGLERAAAYLVETMKTIGYAVAEQPIDVNGVGVKNLEVEIKGTEKPEEIIIIGAHYDSADESPAANDNGSGVAATIELARAFKDTFKDANPSRTIRFVFFVNEEPPYFQTPQMGSRVYAERCKERGEKIVAMLSLETMGYYTDAANSQKYPPPFDQFFPSVGNFIAIVGNTESKDLVEQFTAAFRKSTKFPSQAVAAPDQIRGIGFSDQFSFWKCGYPAIMLTDTAMFRYPHYHTMNDTPEKIDYEKMARVVKGIERAVGEMGK